MKPKSFLRILSIIHASLCGGLLLFTVFAYFQNKDFKASFDEANPFIYLVPIVAMAGYFGSKYLYTSLIKKLSKDETLSRKLQKYQLASIIKYALIEAPSFIALFAYFYSGNAMYLVITISLLAYLFSQRPTLEKLKTELPLSLEQEKELDGLNR